MALKILILSTNNINTEPIINSFINLNYEHRITYYDQGNPNDIMLASALDYMPDVIVYISVAAGPHLASIDTFKKLTGIGATIHFCCDASCPDWHTLLTEYEKNQCFDLTVNIDGNDNWPKFNSGLTMLCPIDHKAYKNTSYISFINRPIHCGFSGGQGSKDRQDMFNYLVEHNAITIKPREEVFGTYNSYVNFLQDSKIILNMANCGSGKAKQVKARVIEAGLAHCMLLEEKGSAASNWFTEGVHFMEYESKEHALEIIEGLRKKDSLMFNYAERLHNKVMNKYSNDKFWDRVLSAAML